MSKCYVYWLRDPQHKDILKEGYIGITKNLKGRESKHKYTARRQLDVNLNPSMRKSLNSGKFVMTALVVGDRDYCLELERKLRPLPMIGWNIDKGGYGGKYLTYFNNINCKRTYYNMLSRAKEYGVMVAEELVNVDPKEFSDFIESNMRDGLELCIDKNTELLSYKTIQFKDRTAIVSDVHAKYVLNEGDEPRTIKSLAEEYSLIPNTVTHRLLRGQTLEQALGICSIETEDRFVSLIDRDTGDAKEYQYSGRMTNSQLQTVKDMFERGSKLTEISKIVGQDAGNLSRVVRKLGLSQKTPIVVGFDGEEIKIAGHSKLGEDEYNRIKSMLIKGFSFKEISDKFNVSGSTVRSAIKKLKWRS